MESFFMEKMNAKVVAGPVDLNTAAIVGTRVDLKNCHRVVLLVLLAAGTTTTTHTFSLKQYNAASGGTAKPLLSDKPYYVKKAAETVFTRVDQLNVDGVFAEEDEFDLHASLGNDVAIVAFEILGEDLDVNGGYRWIGLDVADSGGAQIGTVLALTESKNLPAYNKAV